MPIILTILVPGIIWGLKLEVVNAQTSEKDAVQDGRLAKMETLIDRGILPIASEKIAAANEKISGLEKQIYKLELECRKHNETTSNP